MAIDSTHSTGGSSHEKRRLYKQTVFELRRLSDVGLSDIGVSRSNIPAVAHKAVYGD